MTDIPNITCQGLFQILTATTPPRAKKHTSVRRSPASAAEFTLHTFILSVAFLIGWGDLYHVKNKANESTYRSGYQSNLKTLVTPIAACPSPSGLHQLAALLGTRSKGGLQIQACMSLSHQEGISVTHVLC